MTIGSTNLYIDGLVRPSANGATFASLSPWTGQVIGRAADATAEDMDAAIAAARRGFDQTDWRFDRQGRLTILSRLRDALRARQPELLELARHEAGAANGAAHFTHVEGALGAFDTLLELFHQVPWEEDRGESNAFGVRSKRVVIHEATGVVGAITPWNMPFYMNVAKSVPALLAGCTVVLKAAPDTPLVAGLMGQIAADVGMPAGVLNVITSEHPSLTGEMLVRDPRVDLVAFTGSTGTGRRIMEKGAATLKRIHLELGGKSARIILDDAPDFAREVAESMVVFHAGQVCAATTRLLVPRSRYAEAVAALEMAYAGFSLQWGDIDAPAQIMGPLASQRQLDTVLGYVALGQSEGARLLAGGNARPDKGGGYFMEPTCFVDVSNDMRIAQEEIFGPILCVIPFEDDEDAIRIANDSEYGLSGGVVSGDAGRGMRVARLIRTGSVSVNGGMCMAPDLPFGGFKSSGIGREWGVEGILAFTEAKAVGLRLAEQA